MEPDEADSVAQELMATLDTLFLAERQARLQVSALEERRYPLAETFKRVREMSADTTIEETLAGLDFEYHALDEDAELWISDRYGLMLFLFFTAPDGRYYNYRLVAFDVVGEEEEETFA